MKLWPFLILAIATPALAEDEDGLCADHIYDPPPLPLRYREVDAPRAACRHADVGATAVGTSADGDVDDLYVSFAIRVVEADWIEWGLGLRAFDGQFVGGEYDDFGYGPVFGHIAFAHPLGSIAGVPRRSLTYVAAELPYTRSDLVGSTGALQVGHASTWLLTSRFQLHAHAALTGELATEPAGPGTPADAHVATSFALDVGILALPWLTGFVGGEARTGGLFGWDAPEVNTHVSVHWRVRGLWRSYAGAAVPLVSEYPADLAVSFGVRRDLD